MLSRYGFEWLAGGWEKMDWKIVAAGFTALFWGFYCYITIPYTAFPAPHAEPKSQPAREAIASKRDFGGYLLGESYPALLQHLRSSGWGMRGNGLFYRPTEFSRRKGQCTVTADLVNCHLAERSLLMFTIATGKVVRISGYLDKQQDTPGWISSVSESYGTQPISTDPKQVVWNLGLGLHLKLEDNPFDRWVELYQS